MQRGPLALADSYVEVVIAVPLARRSVGTQIYLDFYKATF